MKGLWFLLLQCYVASSLLLPCLPWSPGRAGRSPVIEVLANL